MDGDRWGGGDLGGGEFRCSQVNSMSKRGYINTAVRHTGMQHKRDEIIIIITIIIITMVVIIMTLLHGYKSI